MVHRSGSTLGFESLNCSRAEFRQGPVTVVNSWDNSGLLQFLVLSRGFFCCSFTIWTDDIEAIYHSGLTSISSPD